MLGVGGIDQKTENARMKHVRKVLNCAVVISAKRTKNARKTYGYEILSHIVVVLGPVSFQVSYSRVPLHSAQ